jgi:adenylate kinase family enzyme
VRKRLIVVNGAMGVGKTTVCRELVRLLPGNTAWLDGDWGWAMHPFRVTDENKRMVEGNIAHLLRAYLTNSSFCQVVFCWVLHQTEILERLLERLADLDFELCWYTLVAEPECLRRRMLSDGRDEVAVEASLSRLALYEVQSSWKVDTTRRSPREVAAELASLLGARADTAGGGLP